MVKALVDIDEHANRVINVVKAKYGLKDKSEAIEMMSTIYEEDNMDLELRPEFVEALKKARKEKATEYSSADEFFEEIEK